MTRSYELIGRPSRSILNVIRDHRSHAACIYPVFLVAGARMSLLPLIIFDDGVIRGNFGLAFADSSHPSGRDECDLHGLEALVSRGLLRTSLNDGQRVYVPNMVGFRTTDVTNICTEREFLKEVVDIIEVLNNRPASWHTLLEIYGRCQNSPSEENRILLKNAYDRVPKHLAICLLPDDRTPIEIERMIAGEEGPGTNMEAGNRDTPDGFGDH